MNTAAVHTSSLMGWLPVVAILVAAFFLVKWGRKNRRHDAKRLTELDNALASIRKQVLIVSTGTVPQQSVVKTIGFLESTSRIEVSSNGDYQVAEREALLELGCKALSMGANAIVGLRKTHAHYDQAGSQWDISRVTYSGTAVVIADRYPG